jgi:hypothetical protein
MGADRPADRYWRTETGRKMFRVRMKHRSLFSWMDAIPPALCALGEPQDVDWALGPGVFDAAVRDYLRVANRRPKRS